MPRKSAFLLSLALLLSLLTGCYQRTSITVITPDEALMDSDSVDTRTFRLAHHYTIGANFEVWADSLFLQAQPPMLDGAPLFTDTFTLPKGDLLAVADVVMVPTDTIDSVWVKVAHDQCTMGWLHEHNLLQDSVPADPISRFIRLFSNRRILFALGILVLGFLAFLIRTFRRRTLLMVHFNDIPSFYPTAFVLSVSLMALFYAHVQHLHPSLWQEFYFNPTLNPFGQPLPMALFLLSVWQTIVLAIAVVDEVWNSLSVSEYIPYMLVLFCVASVDYLVFSIATFYWIGYPLFLVYAAFAIHHYWAGPHERFYCGRCGRPMVRRGLCPHCGMLNR